MKNNFFINSNFKKLYFAGSFSELGSFITEAALMLYIFKQTSNDTAYLGITRAVFLFFLTLGNSFGGPLGQKYDKKKILIFTNLLRIPLIMLLMASNSATVIIILNGLVAFFTGIFNPSRQSLINEIVDANGIRRANSLFGSTMAILHMVGPLLGALMYAHFQGVNEVLIFDFFTYFVAIALIWRMSGGKELPPQNNNDSLRSHFKNALAYVKLRPDLIGLLANTFLAGLCIGLLIPLLLPFAKDTLHTTDQIYGVLLSSFGLGGILGGFTCSYLSHHIKSGKLIIYCFCMEPLFMAAWINTSYIPLSIFIFFLWGIVVFMRLTSQLNYISDTVETSMLTHVHSYLDMAFVVPNISGGILVAILAQYFTTFEILKVVSIAFFFFVFAGLLSKGLRSLYNNDATKILRETYE